ncbi:MAG: PAS domain-containing protein [Candidatus Lokiarchaeota archaeon]|nr:PAS domain-containing protein [Candidatus Lokiarchaeota archaeon]
MDDLKQFISEGKKWFEQYSTTIRKYAIELRESKELLSTTLTTLNSIGDAVITTNNNGIIRFINPLAGKLTCWEKDEATGRSAIEVFNVIKKGSRNQIKDSISRIVREKKILRKSNHLILLTKDKR